MSSGFEWLERKTPEFPNQQLLDVAKWQHEHHTGKPTEVSKLSELDRLRLRAQKGGLW